MVDRGSAEGRARMGRRDGATRFLGCDLDLCFCFVPLISCGPLVQSNQLMAEMAVGMRPGLVVRVREEGVDTTPLMLQWQPLGRIARYEEVGRDALLTGAARIADKCGL